MRDCASIIPYLASLAAAASALVFGAKRLLRKSTLAYFQFLIWGAACFALASLSAFVNYVCGSTDNLHVTLASCGIIGVLIAFLCANMGVLDKLVDEKNDSTRKARRIAFVTPVVFAAALGVACVRNLEEGRGNFSLLIIALGVPMVLGSYYNTKHLLLPMDGMQILKMTRGCNIMCLLFDAAEVVYMTASAYEKPVVTDVCYVVRSLIVLVLIVFAVRGSKEWSL